MSVATIVLIIVVFLLLKFGGKNVLHNGVGESGSSSSSSKPSDPPIV